MLKITMKLVTHVFSTFMALKDQHMIVPQYTHIWFMLSCSFIEGYFTFLINYQDLPLHTDCLPNLTVCIRGCQIQQF